MFHFNKVRTKDTAPVSKKLVPIEIFSIDNTIIEASTYFNTLIYPDENNFEYSNSDDCKWILIEVYQLKPMKMSCFDTNIETL